MVRWLMLMSFVVAGVQPTAAPKVAVKKAAVDGPQYTADGQLKYPVDYREWVFLSSGLDMSYNSPAAATQSTFNNVFVNPSAYRAFLKTGTWPDGTMMMLELRGAEGNHSINKRGQTQSAEVRGLEIHVKDSTHLKGDGWGFYGFHDEVSGKLIDRPATCYTCHEEHAAVDTTFTQFYPTLLPVAKAKGTLSKEYLKDEAAAGVAPAAK
jgi:Cytochrome P460